MGKKKGKNLNALRKKTASLKDVLFNYSKIEDLKKEALKSAEARLIAEKRFLAIEVHLNLLTRLLTTLCIEKFGIRALALKRLVRRIEKEASRDSQIMELESLYGLSTIPPKKTLSAPIKGKDDPWEQIS